MQKNVLEMLFAAVVPTVHRPACSVAACGGCCCNGGVLLHRDRKNSVRVKVDRREVVICRPKSRFFKPFKNSSLSTIQAKIALSWKCP